MENASVEVVEPRFAEALRRETGEILALRRVGTIEEALVNPDEISNLLGFLQWYDSLASAKAGAVLGFSGVILAADLVLLSAGVDSCVAVSGAKALLAYTAALLLSVSAFLSLVVFALKVHTSDQYRIPENILGQYCLHIRVRLRWNTVARLLSVAGVVLFAAALSLRLYDFFHLGMQCGKN